MNDEIHPDIPTLGKLGDYQLQSKIAEGGMGAVYLAEQVNTRRKVAIKILPRKMVSDGMDSIVRFQQEIATLAKLVHPNIVSILGKGETDEGDPWYAMEYIEGETLDAHIRKGGLTTDHIYSWIPQLCDALEFAHANEIVHRDIKPANILISTTGQVKIVDFGLAKHMDAKQTAAFLQTQVGVALGTPHFMSPEQLDGSNSIDGRADIYSLGVLLYNFLTTKLPKANWKHPSQVVPALPVEFDEIVCKSLEEDPDDRFATVGAFRKALENVPKLAAAREDEEARTAPVQARARQSSRGARRKTEVKTKSSRAPLVAAVVLSLLVAAGVGAWKLLPGGDAESGTDSTAVVAVSESPEESSKLKDIPKDESEEITVEENQATPVQAEVVAPLEQPSLESEEPVDLLQFVDLSRNPNWEMVGGTLVSPECGFDSPNLPSPIEAKGIPIPYLFPDRYQLRLKVRSESGTGMKVYVPLPEGRNAAVYVSREIGVGIGDVHLDEENPTKEKLEMSPLGKGGGSNLIVMNVADGQFDLFVDGEPLTEWKQANQEETLGGKMINIPPVLPGGAATDLGLWAYRQYEFEEISLHPYGAAIPDNEPENEEPVPSGKLTGPVDLLQHIDVSVNPNWKMEGGKLVSPECAFSDPGLPLPGTVKGISIPFDLPESYSMRIKLRPDYTKPMGIQFYLPVGNGRLANLGVDMGGKDQYHWKEFRGNRLVLSGKTLEDADNPSFETGRDYVIPKSTETELLLHVHPDRFTLEADGYTVVHWEKGEEEDALGNPVIKDLSNILGPSEEFISLFAQSRYTFEAIELLPFQDAPPPSELDLEKRNQENTQQVTPVLTGTVDLLEHVDLSLNPNWKMEDGALISPKSMHDDPALPVPETLKGISIPFKLPDSYSLKLSLSPNFSDPGGNLFYLPVGGDRRLVVVADRSGPKVYGWSGKGTRLVLPGKEIKDPENPSFVVSRGYLFPPGMKTEVIVDVHPDRFTMEVDGGTILHWERGPSDQALGIQNSASISMIAQSFNGGLSIFSGTGYTYDAIELLPFRNTSPAPKLDVEKRNREKLKQSGPVLTGPVDLLEHVDLSLNPNWKMEDGVLISPECSYSKDDGLPRPEVVKGIAIPFPLPGSFELRMKGRLQSKVGGGCRLFLPVGTDRGTILHIDCTISNVTKDPGSFLTFQGIKENNPSLYNRQRVTNGGDEFEFTVTIRRDAAKFESSGRTIIDWKQEEDGPELGNLSVDRTWANIDGNFGRSFALFMHASYAIEELVVRPLPDESAPPASTTESSPPAPVNVEVNPVALLRSTAADPVPPGVKERFDQLAGPFEAAWKTRAIDVYESGLAKLNQSYVRALGQAQSKAAKENVDLEAAKAIREERSGIQKGTFTVPHLDPPGTPELLVSLRTTYRAQLEKLRKERSANQRKLLQQLDRQLAAIQNTLTKSEKIDEALFVKERREKVAELLSGETLKGIQPSVRAPAKSAPAPAPSGVAVNEGIQVKRPTPGTLVLINIQNGSVQNGWSKMSTHLTNVSEVDVISGGKGAVIRGDGRLETFGDKNDSSAKNIPAGLVDVVATGGETDPHGWRYVLQEDGSFFHWGDWGRDVKLPKKFESLREIRRSGFRAFHVVDGEGEIQMFGEEDHWPLPPKLRRLRDVKSVTSIEFSTVVLFEDGSVEILDPENDRFTKRDHDAADKIEDGVKVISYLGESRESLVLTKSGSVFAFGWGDDFTLPDLPNDLTDVAIMERPHGDRKPIGAVRSASRGWIFFGEELTPEIAAKLAENSRGFDRLSIQHTFVFGINTDPKAAQ